MNITRKNFLRLTSAATVSTAIGAAVTACGGGGGGGGGGGSSASSSTSSGSGTGTGTGTPTGSGAGDGTVITPPTVPPATPSATGFWSDPATWAGPGVPAGYIPTAADNIYITSAQTVYLDSTAICATLTVYGTLRSLPSPTGNISLTTGNINVMGSGVLQIGTDVSPFPAAYTATITLNGAEVGRVTRNVNGTNLGFSNSGEGRSIRVEAGGVLSLVGSAPTYKRTKLNAHAAAGANSFTLMDNTGWKANDEIVIGTTDFYGVSVPEKLTLSANASGAVVTTTSAIATKRWGLLQYVTDSGMSLTPGALTGAPSGAPTVLDERAFVINLTRNIVVQGANDIPWTSNKFGAHCMFMGRTSTIKLDGVQFRRMGQAGALGRYPIHWHMMSFNMPSGVNAVSDGTFLGAVVGSHYAKNCSISESSQRMITIHGTQGVTLDSNVGFDITGHAIFLEDGSEQDNIITNNVVMKVRAPTSTNKLLNHDVAASAVGTEFIGVTGVNGTSGIWFTNPKNTLNGNWVNDAAGTGIWNAFATQCFGLSIGVAISPYTKIFTSFQNNIAYGCNGVGVQTNRPPINDKGDLSDSTTYQGSFFTNPVIGTQVFKNRAGGYSNRVLDAQYQSFICADNAGMDVFGQAQNERSIAVNFLNVAESLNNSTSLAVSSKRTAFATYHELLNFQNGIVVGYSYISGSFYNDSSLATGGGIFRLEDLYLQPIFTFYADTGNKLINTPAPYRSKPPNIDGASLAIPSKPGFYRNWTLAGAIKDVNGMFVQAGNYWVYDDPFFTYTATNVTQVAPNGTNGVSTPDRYFGVQGFSHTNDISAFDYIFNLPLTVTRQDSNGNTQGTWVVGDGLVAPVLGWMRHFAPHNGGRYKLQFPGFIATTVVQFDVILMDNVNDIFLIGVEWSNSVPAKVIQRASQFTSFSGAGVPASPGNSSISRVLTSTGSFANVVADQTGTIFWQDTTNNLVWFKVKVGSLAQANAYGSGSRGVYKPVSIAVTA